MIKRISILVRAPHIDRAGFSKHWHDVHGGLVAQLPGIAGYIQNHVVEEFSGVAAEPGAYDIDGFVELFFPDDAARVNAFTGPHTKPMWDDEPNFLGHSTAYVIEGDWDPRRALTDAKLMLVAQGLRAAVDRLAERLRQTAAGAQLERNDVAEVVPRANMARGPQPADVFFHLRFATPDDAREAGRVLADTHDLSDGLERVAITRVVERRIV